MSDIKMVDAAGMKTILNGRGVKKRGGCYADTNLVARVGRGEVSWSVKPPQIVTPTVKHSNNSDWDSITTKRFHIDSDEEKGYWL